MSKAMLVTSIGGHIAELLELVPVLEAEGTRTVWVLNDESPVLPAGVPAWKIAHAERDWRVVWNFFELGALLARERPDVVMSMGAGPAVPAAILARLAGIPFVYVEPSSAVRVPTMTGRILRWLTPHRFAQWPDVARILRARCPGAIL